MPDWYKTATEVAADAIEQGIEERRLAVQRHIDETAKSRGYDNGHACVSYVDDPRPEWDAEARAFRAWRSDVWDAVFAAMDAWQAGGEPPTMEALIAGLPAMEWPND